jgi:hypothetical protein
VLGKGFVSFVDGGALRMVMMRKVNKPREHRKAAVTTERGRNLIVTAVQSRISGIYGG